MSLRVLMVDDEESLVWSFGHQFRHERPEWVFEGFTDPLAALESIRAAPPDVLITDIRMPSMSGIELLVAARAVAPSLPAVVVTAYGSPEVLAAVRIRSNVECLEKPVRVEALVEVIERLRARGEGFSGAISLPLLPDLLQIYTLSLTSGALTLERRADKGAIWFERGEIIHATCGSLVGPEAVYELLTWQGGSFNFDGQATASERSIRQTWQALLLEGCRRLDERSAAAWDPAEAELERQTDRFLSGLQAQIPGFIGAAVVNSTTGRTVGSLSARRDFEPAAAALLAGGAAFPSAANPNDPGPRPPVEDVLFTLSDQLHFLRRTTTDELLYVVTERHDSINLALVRSAVSRQLAGPRPNDDPTNGGASRPAEEG